MAQAFEIIDLLMERNDARVGQQQSGAHATHGKCLCLEIRSVDIAGAAVADLILEDQFTQGVRVLLGGTPHCRCPFTDGVAVLRGGNVRRPRPVLAKKSGPS